MPSIAKIQNHKGNETCADCPNKHPPWVSFLADASQDSKVCVEGFLAVLVCDECAQHHQTQLGTRPKRLQDCTRDELKMVESSGNAFVNRFYEVVHFEFEKNKVTKHDDKRRAAFIKAKYKDCKFRNDVSLSMALTRLNPKQMEGAGKKDSKSSKEETQKPIHHHDNDENNPRDRYRNLNSLVQNKTSTPRNRQPEPPIQGDKMQKLAAGMAKTQEGLQDSSTSCRFEDFSGQDGITKATEMLAHLDSHSTAGFAKLANQVEILSGTGHPKIEPSKLKKLTEGMHHAMEEMAPGDDQAGGSRQVHSSELRAAKELGANMAKAYDDDVAHMRRIAKRVMDNAK
jgi:Putative GTPase activating protein for Arf